MLIEVMLICALTNVEPFYDCNQEKWILTIYDNYRLNDLAIAPKFCDMSQSDLRDIYGCASFMTNRTKDKERIPLIMLSSTKYKDNFGMSTLEHELKHVKCRCVWSGHNE